MKRKSDLALEYVNLGRLELNLNEAEMLLAILQSVFGVGRAANTKLPQELIAIREKLSLLVASLKEEQTRRDALLGVDQ